jgi:hypothetical protein
MFQKRHYEAVAEAIRVARVRAPIVADTARATYRYRSGSVVDRAIDEAIFEVTRLLANVFAEDNLNFDRTRFMDATRPKEPDNG